MPDAGHVDMQQAVKDKPAWLEYQPTLNLQKLKFINNSAKLFKPLSVALSVPVSPSESGTMAPCGLPVLTGRELLFTPGQDTQLSGRRAPFLSLSVPAVPPSTPSPSLSGSHFYSNFSPPLSWPSSQLSPSQFLSLSEWTHPRSLSKWGWVFYLTALLLLIFICFILNLSSLNRMPYISHRFSFFVCPSKESSL